MRAFQPNFASTSDLPGQNTLNSSNEHIIQFCSRLSIALIISFHVSFQDLVYKGVIKFTYDRGYALQTKSTLVDSGMTTNAVIDRLIDSLGLTGDVEDYQLQEINHMTKGLLFLKRAQDSNIH